MKITKSIEYTLSKTCPNFPNIICIMLKQKEVDAVILLDYINVKILYRTPSLISSLTNGCLQFPKC